MHIKKLIVLSFFVLSHALAQTSSTLELWSSLKEDFESKSFFFNANLNQSRDGVMSPYIIQLFNGYKYNNAGPLPSGQLNRLPDAYFLDPKVLDLALKGREKLLKAKKIKDIPVMAIIDYSASSRARRLFVIDLKKKQVLINNWVSHAKNSDADGDGYPETFSNQAGSELSSVGFMYTSVTYQGQWGYSLRLNGLDTRLNSNVLSRAVVIHPHGAIGAQAASWGNISTSQGCFMVSMSESGKFWGLEDEPMSKIVVDTLKNGALIFVYTDVEDKMGGKLIYKSDWITEND